MAYGTVRTGMRIFVLLLLVIVLALGGLLWFDYLGLLDTQNLFKPVLTLVGLSKPTPLEDPGASDLLEQERMSKQWQALDIRRDELDLREKQIAEKEIEIQQMQQLLEEKQKALEEEKKSFNDLQEQYDNKNENLRKVSEYLVSMNTDQAVKILAAKDDQEIIDLLRVTDQVAAQNEKDVYGFNLAYDAAGREGRRYYEEDAEKT